MAKIKSLITDVIVDVHCVTSYPKHIVNADQYLDIIDAISEYKKSNEWISAEKPDYMYYEGRRFNDNERICDAILGNIRLGINKSIFDGNKHADISDPLKQQIMEDSFLVYLQYLICANDLQKLNEWIKSSLLYSAGSDYWYKYEKDWN